jgi:exosome complex component RRP4
MNSPYSSVLQVKDATFDFIAKGADLTKYFDLGDYLVAKIIQVTSQNLVDVTCKGPGLKKLTGGRVIRVGPHKVPRIIGTKGSMISMVKKATGCKIVVGQNGVIWMDGEPDKEALSVEVIRFIEEHVHLSGLTDKVKKLLMEKTGVTEDELKASQQEEESHQREDRPERRERSPRTDRGGDRDRRRPYPPRRR